MKNVLVPMLTALAAAALASGQELEVFSYSDTETACEHWQPRSGSAPVRVEKPEDGTTCLALEAEFEKHMDGVCWDWSGPLDLSQASRIAFEISASNGGLAESIGIYFGTPNGWYARFLSGGVPDSWTPRTFRLDTFRTEGQPDGWDKVTKFRFSCWAMGPGKSTFRLRGLRVIREDAGENFIVNGSFEIPGVGIPYAWGSRHWGIGRLPWAADMDLWRKHWRIDRSVAKHGAASLCIDNTPDLPLLQACSAWVNAPKSAERCTLSAWLKSGQDKMPATIACGGRSVTTEVGREWRQVTLSGIPRSERMMAAVTPGLPGKLWIDAVQLQGCEVPAREFHPAFVDAGITEREKLVDWSPPRRVKEVAAGRVITGPVHHASTRIDEHGRFLLGGQPYVQHSVGLEFVSNLDILNFVAKSGFKDVCVQIQPTVTTQRLADIFDRCAEVGLHIIPWLDGRIPRERFAQHIKTLRDHPALLCWYVYDEPSGERFEEANARLALAKELDPSRPAFINYLANKLEGHLGDIYSTDVYPIPHSAPNAAINAVARMKAAAWKEKKPVWMWLQGTGHAYWMAREPSPRELSCMVYGSLIAGARGIYYFAQIPRTQECFDEMRALCVEVDAVASALYSLDPAPRLTCDAPDILCDAFAHEGSVWILAVNTGSSTREVHLALTAVIDEFEMPFEGRRVKATSGRWQDEFGPYERHAYKANLATRGRR